MTFKPVIARHAIMRARVGHEPQRVCAVAGKCSGSPVGCRLVRLPVSAAVQQSTVTSSTSTDLRRTVAGWELLHIERKYLRDNAARVLGL